MQKIHINYANEDFKIQQKRNSELSVSIGNVNKTISYSPEDVDAEFYKKNNKILNKIRGAGYWLWKPYCILKALESDAVKNGDIVFYTDSGIDVLKDLSSLLDYPEKYNQDVILFGDSNCSTFTKRDCFIVMDCDEQGAYDAPMCAGAFSIWRKSDFSIAFVKEWLKYSCDERVLTDKRSTLAQELPNFMMHRHDQCPLSLIAYKQNLKILGYEKVYGYETNGVKPDTYLLANRANNRNKWRRCKYKVAILPEKLWRYGGFWGYLFRQFKKK